jgi:hypothetical protein
MANMSVFYEIVKHATANPSNILAAEGGAHMYSVKLDTDTDNGNLVAIGDWISLDQFAEAAVTTFEGKIVEKMANGNYLVLVTDPGDACFVYQVPVGAEEWTNKWKAESNLYNAAGDIVRVYGLVKHDRFEVSAEGFEGAPEVGKSITGVTDKKMVVA